MLRPSGFSPPAAAPRPVEPPAAELERAREHQRRLVPLDVRAGRVEGVVVCQPAGHVGGDYADIVPTADGRILAIVADVCGAGIPAALVAAGIHAMVWGLARFGVALTDLVCSLNDYLREYLPEDEFVTAVCLTLDPFSGRIDFINAGHPLPRVVDSGGRLRHLDGASSPPLGIFSLSGEPGFETLAGGEVLAIFTDGWIDALLTTEETPAADRLDEVLRSVCLSAAPGDAGGVAGQLRKELRRLGRRADHQDDRTFLIIKRV